MVFHNLREPTVCYTGSKSLQYFSDIHIHADVADDGTDLFFTPSPPWAVHVLPFSFDYLSFVESGQVPVSIPPLEMVGWALRCFLG